MIEVILTCPKCGATIKYRNWFSWVKDTPFHWFGKRKTKCHYCEQYSYMKRESKKFQDTSAEQLAEERNLDIKI